MLRPSLLPDPPLLSVEILLREMPHPGRWGIMLRTEPKEGFSLGALPKLGGRYTDAP